MAEAAPKAEILSQGEELLHGDIADTNAAWLSQRLVRLGFDVVRHTAVGDRLEDLIGLMREIANRADLCLSTGGLGPTCDDLTAEAFAVAFDRPLQLDPVALSQIEERYRRYGRVMPHSNRRQALLPFGSERLDNHWGTAPGFWVQQERCHFGFMPGVPEEMRAIFHDGVEPRLRRGFLLCPEVLVIFRTMGQGESNLQESVGQVDLPSAVRLGFRASAPVVDVKLQFPVDYPPERVNAVADAVHRCLGTAVVARWRLGDEEPDTVAAVGALLAARGLAVAALETVSGGVIGSRCLGQPWFLESRVASVEPLLRRAGIDPQTWRSEAERHAALTDLAQAQRCESGADYLLAQFECATANATTFLVVSREHAVCTDLRFTATGDRRQRVAAEWSLELLRRELLAAAGTDGD